MFANHVRSLFTVLTGLTLLTGCLPTDIDQEQPIIIGAIAPSVGDACDWEDPNACGDNLQCDRIVDAGEVLADGICMKSQGARCDAALANSTFDPCGRALACQSTRRDAEEFRCLPNTCIDDSECVDGQGCKNNICVTVHGCQLTQ